MIVAGESKRNCVSCTTNKMRCRLVVTKDQQCLVAHIEPSKEVLWKDNPARLACAKAKSIVAGEVEVYIAFMEVMFVVLGLNMAAAGQAKTYIDILVRVAVWACLCTNGIARRNRV